MSEENKSVKAIVAEKLIKLGQSLLEVSEDKKPVEMMAQGELTDGSKIVTPADVWEAGVEIFIETEEGAVPLAPGEYTLVDGTAIVVEQEGILHEIRPVAAEEVQAEKEEPKPAANMDEQKVKSIVESMVKEYRFASHEQFEAMQNENKELKETIVMLSDALQELSKPYEAKKNETENKSKPVEMRDASKLEGEAKFAAIRERYQFN